MMGTSDSSVAAGDIFIIDDNSNNLTLLAGLLRDAGYRVRAANSGRRAIDMVRKQPPELILLDISMPEMDGYEVCTHMKQIESIKDVPIIFISALDDVFDKVKAFKVGGVDYITKPFQTEEVIARVETHLKVHRLGKENQEKTIELERQNLELQRKNEELLAERRRTDRVFSALTEVLEGSILDKKYRLEEKIGSGGFGSVYRATHLGLDHEVAVKIFRPSEGNDTPQNLERFRREGISACMVRHQNAVSVMDFGISSSGIAYLVMELLNGRTLWEILRDVPDLTIERAAQILVPVCRALEAAHEAGIVHRDIKPDNVFLHEQDGEEVVKVVDFGIAKLMQGKEGVDTSDLTTINNFVGTPHYVAPERIMDISYSGKADVYSVGVMMYRMLCGRLPFSDARARTSHSIAFLHMTSEPPAPSEINTGIPKPFERIILSAMAKEADERPTAGELADMIEAYVESR